MGWRRAAGPGGRGAARPPVSGSPDRSPRRSPASRWRGRPSRTRLSPARLGSVECEQSGRARPAGCRDAGVGAGERGRGGTVRAVEGGEAAGHPG